MQYTPHIRLPLFESADKPTWLYDWNETMTKLDDVIYEINSSDIPAELAELVSRVNALERTVSQHTSDITELQDQATSILSDINLIMSIIPPSASPTNKLATMADIEGGSTPGIPIASATQLGGIKVGTGFTVDPTTGVANVIGGTSFTLVGSADLLDSPYETMGSSSMDIDTSHMDSAKYQLLIILYSDSAPNPNFAYAPKMLTANIIDNRTIIWTFGNGSPNVQFKRTEGKLYNYRGEYDYMYDVRVYLLNSSGAAPGPTPPPSGGEVTTITDPQVTSGASTLNAETLSITDVIPLS